ncbi:MAG TPA: glycosyltransferase family 4 protein [Bacteroidales bacterium]|nr:glycosyltransferase family 4 protein [Bacteroidales bacterium]
MFGWEFPPHITGGLGTACFGLTKGLLKNGVEVLFVVPRSYGDEDQQAIRLINASDVSIDFTNKAYQEYWKQLTYIEVGSNLIPYVGEEEFEKMTSENLLDKTEEHSGVFSKQYVFSGKYGKNLMEEVTRYALVASTIAGSQQFDVIHAHDWLTYPAGMTAKKVSGKPLVVHMHATEFDRSGENINQNVYDIERKGMEAADAVITVSNYTRDIVIDRYGINPAKVFTVHNAVEHSSSDADMVIKRNVKEKVVTFLGRVTFQKGPDYFVEAAKRVIEKDKNVRFVMAGSGDMLHRMILRVAQLGISTHFHFTGFLQGEEVDKMFLLSDVYVMPSVSEPFGISPLEAMRSNVPVVISKQSGVSEVLKYALKIDFWDIDAMADAIYGLLHYDALSVMFRKHGKAEVENLKWDSASSKIKDVYYKVVH